MQQLTDRQKAVLSYIAESIGERGYPPTLREIGNRLGIRSTNGVNDHLRALERKGFLTREDMKSRTLRPTDEAYRAVGTVGARVLAFAGTGSFGRSAGLGHSTMATAGGDTSASHGKPVGWRATRALERDGGSARGLPAQLDDLITIPIVGRVAAGALSEAIEQPEDTVRIDRMLVGRGEDVFGLRIAGESMIEAGIHDGDYVFVRKQLTAQRGEIVVAMVGEEATCKQFFEEREHIRLQPRNQTMAPILIPKNDWRSTQILGVVVGVYRKLK